MKCDVKICQTPATKTIRRPPTEEEFEIELDKSDDGCTFPICFIAQVCNRHYDELLKLYPNLNQIT